jgi:hypothetical protein
MTREQWLMDAIDIFRPWFEEVEKPLPETIRVSVGYGKGQRQSTIGVCYNSHSAEDKIHQVFISPELIDPTRVLDVLLHECVHAADDGVSGHTGEFRRVAKGLGLEGKMTATVASEELRAKLTTIADKLGEYPHGRLDPRKRAKVQKTYMLKVVCIDKGCGYFFRLTKKHAERGLPFCVCGSEMDFG